MSLVNKTGFRLRRDTTANLAAITLSSGEPAVETNGSKRLLIGDGTTNNPIGATGQASLILPGNADSDSATGNTWPADLKCACTLVDVPFPYTFTLMKMYLYGTIAAGDKFDLAIFDKTYTTRYVHTGWMTVSGTSAQTLSATVTSYALIAQTYGYVFSFKKGASSSPSSYIFTLGDYMQILRNLGTYKVGLATESADNTTGIPTALTSLASSSSINFPKVVLLA